MKKKKSIFSLIVMFGLIGMTFLFTPTARAATLNVCAGCGYTTIQAAITAATAGDTINVAAGVYAERIVIDKALTLLGATANVSKKNYVVPGSYAYDANVESIIKPATDALLPVIDVNKVPSGGDISGLVTIKGFVITDQGALNNNAERNLISLKINTGLPDGILIENNVIGPHTGPGQNGLIGRGGICSQGPNNVSRHGMVIKDNLIFDSLGDGVGIMLVGAYIYKGSTQDFSGARIENNTISGNTRSGIEIAGGVNGSIADPFVIANNTVKDNGWKIAYGIANYAANLKYGNGINFIRGGGETDTQNGPAGSPPTYPFSSPSYVNITGNEITHNEKNGIYMGPMPQHITVTGNTIQSNGTGGGSYQTWDGVRVDLEENYYGVPGARAHTLPLVLDQFSGNVFNYNTIAGNGIYSVNVIQTPSLGPVNATNNWWGRDDGPAGVGPGNGGKVTTNVLYNPWLVKPFNGYKYLMADYGSAGLWIFDGVSGGTRATTSNVGAMAYYFDGTNERVCAADSTGLWSYLSTIPHTPAHIGGAVPDNLMAFKSVLLIDYGKKYGLYKYDGSSFTQLGSADPGIMCNVGPYALIDYPGYGLYKFDGANFTLIGSAHPENIIKFGSGALVDYGTAYGLYLYNGSGFTNINAHDPGLMVSIGSYALIDFPGYGLYKYEGGSLTIIGSVHPENIVALSGTVALIDYGTAYGLYKYDGSNFIKIGSADVAKMVQVNSQVYLDYAVYGLYKYDGTTFTSISKPPSVATVAEQMLDAGMN